MTLAQFRRMKPKYKFRLILAGALAIALFVGMLLGVSAIFSAARTHLNTKSLDGVTLRNILLQSSFAKIMNVAGQDDPENIYVLNSRIVCDDLGAILEFEMNFVDVKSTKEAATWLVHLDEKKIFMRRTLLESRNRNALSYTKMTFGKYFPSLSRITAPQFLEKLQEELPVGSGGQYIFEDVFDDNLNPQFSPYLQDGYLGYIVSASGGISNLTETYKPTPGNQVPMVISAAAVDEKRSKPKRIILQDAIPQAVVLFGTGLWANV